LLWAIAAMVGKLPAKCRHPG